jgi:hypothetical protein
MHGKHTGAGSECIDTAARSGHLCREAGGESCIAMMHVYACKLKAMHPAHPLIVFMQEASAKPHGHTHMHTCAYTCAPTHHCSTQFIDHHSQIRQACCNGHCRTPIPAAVR